MLYRFAISRKTHGRFFFIYRLIIFEILFELEDLNDNEFNGVSIYTILSQNGSDMDQDSDKSDDEHVENRMCCLCKTNCFQRTSVIMEKTNNKRSSGTACLTGTAH